MSIVRRARGSGLLHYVQPAFVQDTAEHIAFHAVLTIETVLVHHP